MDVTWGYEVQGGSSTGAGTAVRAMSNVFPYHPHPRRLVSVSICFDSVHADQIRLAVWLGGTLTSPVGAILLEDLGQTAGTATDTFVPVQSVLRPVLPSNGLLWLSYKWTGTSTISYAASEPSVHDFQANPNGRWAASGAAFDEDETVAYPTSWPSNDSGSYGTSWASVYLTYEFVVPPRHALRTRRVRR